MPQSLARNIIHLTFSTKLRARLILDDVRADLTGYVAGIFTKLLCPAIEINCRGDHVHALFCLSKNAALSSVIKEVKQSSSLWMKTHPASKDFYWQGGYAAFSVSQSNVDAVRKYIVNQDEHHRKMTFEQELVALLKRNHVEYDERYIFD